MKKVVTENIEHIDYYCDSCSAFICPARKCGDMKGAFMASVVPFETDGCKLYLPAGPDWDNLEEFLSNQDLMSENIEDNPGYPLPVAHFCRECTILNRLQERRNQRRKATVI